MNGFSAPGQSVWQEARTPEGKIYYFKPGTQETTWEKPPELATDVDRAVASTPWKEYKTPEGKSYWHNPESGETTWSLPAAVIDKQKTTRENQPQRPAATPTAPSNSWAAGPSSLPSYNSRGHDRDDYQPAERRDREREAGYGGDRPAATFGSSTEIMFSNPHDAEEAFKNLLKRLKVQSDWSWPQTIRVGIRDPNWRAIPDPKEREVTFRKYCDDLRAQDKAKEQERQVKLRSDFTAMLQSHPEIKYYTRWKTALPMIENEAIFRSAKDDSERRGLFEDYISTLKRNHSEEEAEEKKSALDDLSALLQSLDLQPFTRWNVAEEKLQNNEEFNGEKFKSLYKVDVLNTFETHIRELQRKLNDQVQADRRVKNRAERKNRDAYIDLLHELQANGRLKAGTKWKDIHKIIHDDPRYLAMLGQSGSTPLELFWDMLEEEDGKFRTHRRYALEVLENRRFEVTTNTLFEDFVGVMRGDPRTSNLDEHSLKSIFAYVIGKVKKREDEERRHNENHERRAMEDLRSVLKRLDPPVSLADTWEVVRPRIDKSEEYRAISSDSLRQSVFDKYIRRLEDKKKDRERDRERDRDRERERDRSRRDPRDRERDRRDRDREYRNGHSDSHRRHRTRTRSPEFDSYAAERRQAQQDREARYRNTDSTGLSPPYRRNRDDDRYEPPRQGSGDHYGRERREREVERERSYVSRADPRERTVSELDYGDSRPVSSRRRRESDESAGRRDVKRPRYSPRHDRRSKTPAQQPAVEPKEDPALRSGSEEGEIEED